MRELSQEIFNGQPEEVDWCGVDYDGKLSFGKAINPRYTYASERWRGFDLIGDPIVDSGYKPLTSIRRDDDLSEEEIFNLSGEKLDAALRKQGYNPRKLEEDAKNLLKRLIGKAEGDAITPDSLKELGFEKDKIVDVVKSDWVDVPGYEGCYQANALGEVRSLDRYVNGPHCKIYRKGRMLKQTLNSKGYYTVSLTIEGVRTINTVHRVIAESLIENPDNRLQVNHINGIKTDNRVENLEWATPAENVKHAWETGLAKRKASFLYVQNRISQITPYLHHRPFVHTPIEYGFIDIDQSAFRVMYRNGNIGNFVKHLRDFKDDFKIVLRPLSDITKEIVHRGNILIIMDDNDENSLFDCGEICFDSIDGVEIVNDVTPYFILKKLHEYMFDTAGLIEQGLAVNIHELKENPYA